MPVQRFVAGVCLAAAGVCATACSDIIDPSKNTITELSGTLPVGQTRQHEFTADRNGEFEIKITALSPNQDAIIGVAYGVFQNNACAHIQTNPIGQLNRVVLGGIMNSGRYCVTVFDVGTISQPENYTLRVSHP